MSELSETVIDLRENIVALYIAILRDDVITVEQAFDALEGIKRDRGIYDEKDTKDMVRMRKQGISWSAISRIYGVSASTVSRRVKGYAKEKDLSVATEKVN